MKTKKIEVLAPAGNPAALKAAVFAGADAVYMGGSLFSARALHKYGVPPVFLNCCSQRSVLTGSFCAVSHTQSSAVTTASFSPSETVTRGFLPAKALNVNVTGTRCASFLYKVCSCANTAEFALSTSSFVRVPNITRPLWADR